MEFIGTIALSAMLVEAVTTAFKPVWDKERRKLSRGALASLAVGLVIAFAAGLDIAAIAGVEIRWPLLPQLITGIIISRGSNYVHDIFKRINTDSANN